MGYGSFLLATAVRTKTPRTRNGLLVGLPSFVLFLTDTLGWGKPSPVWAEVAGRMEGRHWEPGLCPSTPTPICSHSVGEKNL